MRAWLHCWLAAMAILGETGCRRAPAPEPAESEPSEVNLSDAGQAARDAAKCAREIMGRQGGDVRFFLVNLQLDSAGRWVALFVPPGLGPNTRGGPVELTVSTTPCKRHFMLFYQ
jgi:hypothetical protein